jgi:hypothetical protein
MQDLLALVRKHQAGLLLDTNVLLAFLANEVSPAFRMRWKRTEHFQEAHIALLVAAVAQAHCLVTTPHILTEATNLAGGGAHRDEEQKELNRLLCAFARKTPERFTPSRIVAANDAFARLGLADVALGFLGHGLRARPLVLTLDLDLTRHLAAQDLPVANLTWYAFPT